MSSDLCPISFLEKKNHTEGWTTHCFVKGGGSHYSVNKCQCFNEKPFKRLLRRMGKTDARPIFTAIIKGSINLQYSPQMERLAAFSFTTLNSS